MRKEGDCKTAGDTGFVVNLITPDAREMFAAEP